MTAAPEQAPKRPPLSDTVSALMQTIDSFTRVLHAETAALKEMDFETVDTLQPDKMDLSRTYRDCVHDLSARKDEIPALDTGLRERFIAARTAFTKVLAENMRALEAAKDSARRLSERILDIARQSVVDQTHTHYSAKGRTAACPSSGMSLNIDQSL